MRLVEEHNGHESVACLFEVTGDRTQDIRIFTLRSKIWQKKTIKQHRTAKSVKTIFLQAFPLGNSLVYGA